MIQAAFILNNIYWYSLLISFVACLISFFTHKRKGILLLCFHALAMISIDQLARHLGYYYHHNLIVSHIYFTTQLLFIATLYYVLLPECKQFRKVIIAYVMAYFLIIGSILIVDPRQIYQINYTEIFMSFYFFVLCSLFFIYENIGKQSDYFYVNIGVLAYGFVACAHFMLENLYSKTTFNAHFIRVIHNSFIILFEASILLQIAINYYRDIQWKKNTMRTT